MAADIDPRSIVSTLTARARRVGSRWVAGEDLAAGSEYTFTPRAGASAEGIRVIDVTDDRGKWQGVFVVVPTGEREDAVFAGPHDKLRKKDVAVLVTRAAALVGRAYSPAHEAWKSVHRDRKRGAL